MYLYRLASSVAVTAVLTSCLPGDTRPVPSSVAATIEPSAALTAGLDTADGWRVTFDRFVIGVGNFDFEEDDADCNSYAEAHYDRLFDFTVLGRQKLGTAYGLGTCRVAFRVREPSFDALLGPGTTASDKDAMRIEDSDRFAEDDGVSVLAIGAGARGTEAKRFAWSFRRSYELKDCPGDGGGFVSTIELDVAGAAEVRIEARGEELFRSSPDDSADFLFQPIADADMDNDQTVTLDELSRAPRPVSSGGLGGAGGAAEIGEGTLEYLVYGELLPRVLRISGGGACYAELRSRR